MDLDFYMLKRFKSNDVDALIGDRDGSISSDTLSMGSGNGVHVLNHSIRGTFSAQSAWCGRGSGDGYRDSCPVEGFKGNFNVTRMYVSGSGMGLREEYGNTAT